MPKGKATMIVEQYSGPFTRSPENHSLGADDMRLVVVYENGQKEEVFRGNKFDMSAFKARMKHLSDMSILDRIKKTENGYIIT